ncbi:MAG TPA: hypothetical protein VF377_16725, partial [Acidimicrobiia bacterium]
LGPIAARFLPGFGIELFEAAEEGTCFSPDGGFPVVGSRLDDELRRPDGVSLSADGSHFDKPDEDPEVTSDASDFVQVVHYGYEFVAVVLGDDDQCFCFSRHGIGQPSSEVIVVGDSILILDRYAATITGLSEDVE